MRGRILLIVGLGVGYVLGARAGRGRYEEIKDRASKFWNDPRVQKQRANSADFVKEKAPEVVDFVKDKAPDVADFVSDNAKKVATKVSSATKTAAKKTPTTGSSTAAN